MCISLTLIEPDTRGIWGRRNIYQKKYSKLHLTMRSFENIIQNKQVFVNYENSIKRKVLCVKREGEKKILYQMEMEKVKYLNEKIIFLLEEKYIAYMQDW